jgi:O-antigen/teichoic acid export membrane protein
MKRLSKNVIFGSDALSRNLAQKSVRSGITTVSAQACKFILSTAGTIVLARLLTPKDFGLIAMVAVVIGFADMFKDAGLSMATVQKDRISHEQISTLFWINILISAFLGLCVLAASPLVAKFYGRPELAAVTAALSVSFIISGLMIQHQALLRRHMQFGTLAIIQIASQIITLGATIVLALFGWRYWALVSGTITTALTSTLMTLFFCPWIPGRMKKGTGIRDMLKFGGHLTGFNFVNYFARNLDNILIGKYYGSQSLGLYSKAYSLLMLPLRQINSPISAVAIPVLSRLQNDPEQYRKYYLKAISLMAFITLPGVMFMIVMSKGIIVLLLGPQWSEASRIFSVLGFAAFLQPIANTTGWLFISQNRTKHMLQWGVVGGILTIISFVIGIPWGAFGVAVSYAVSGIFIRTPLLFWFVGRQGPIKTIDLYRALLFPGFVALCVASVLLPWCRIADQFNSLVNIIVALALTGTITLLSLIVSSTGRNLLNIMKGVINYVLPTRA